MPPFGRTEKTPGSVPLGIQEKLTRSSIRMNQGRSGAFFTALTGRSAALASPMEANAANDSAAAAIAFLTKDISSTPKLNERTIMALSVTLAPFTAPEKPHLSPTLAASFGKDASSYLRGGVWRMASFALLST